MRNAEACGGILNLVKPKLNINLNPNLVLNSPRDQRSHLSFQAIEKNKSPQRGGGGGFGFSVLNMSDSESEEEDEEEEEAGEGEEDEEEDEEEEDEEDEEAEAEGQVQREEEGNEEEEADVGRTATLQSQSAPPQSVPFHSVPMPTKSNLVHPGNAEAAGSVASAAAVGLPSDSDSDSDPDSGSVLRTVPASMNLEHPGHENLYRLYYQVSDWKSEWASE